jgi:pyroglutamyl-peptidase
MSEKPLAIVTGFGAFPEVRNNPAELVLQTLKRESLGEGVTGQFELLDTEYGAVSRRIADLLAQRPSALVMLGYSRHATSLRLERRATNRRSTEHADAAGFVPQAAPAREVELGNTGIDFGPLAAALAGRGIPAEMSDDCGDYVCNHCYFEALAGILGVALPTRAVFVHIPAVEHMHDAPPGAGAMPLSELTEGVRVIARQLAR